MPGMTLLALSIFISSRDEMPSALRRAEQAVAAGARLIEWRVDSLAEQPENVAIITKLVADSPAPCIVTCRSTSEGGMYEGDDADRLELYTAMAQAEHPPRYLDVELAAFKRSSRWRAAMGKAVESGRTGLILSSHDFDRRPSDLLQRIEQMTTAPECSVIKVAWRARSVRDNLEAFDLLLNRRKPTIAICMGPFGLMSRAIAPKFGGLLTFTTDSTDNATAPGQTTISQLRDIFRFDVIDRDTKTYGVIGWPVAQSRSPMIHNAGFSAVNHNGVFLPLPVPPEYEHFKATVGELIDHPHLDFRGAAVTIPHKENLLRFVRERGGEVDALADRIGAANTLVVGDAGELSCTNTDCPAAIEALANAMRIDRSSLRDTTVTVLGAGGAARAVVVGLTDAGANVRVVNRDMNKAERLMKELGVREAAGSTSDVIINCTPVGMAGGPDPDGLPLQLADGEAIELDYSMTVFDTVYTPQRTPLIAEAESRGARVVTGVDMFQRQAAMQFELWTGAPAPLDVLAAAAE